MKKINTHMKNNNLYVKFFIPEVIFQAGKFEIY